MGVLRPLSGFDASRSSPRSSSGLGRPVEHGDQELQVVLDGPVGHRPSARADPARPPLSDEPVPIALGERLGTAVPSEEPEERPRRRPVGPLRRLRLRGRHLLTVDFKQLVQRERLRLGFRLAVQVRANEPGGEFVRLPLRPHPVAVSQRPGEPSTVLPPLDLVSAGLRIREHPHPIPAPFAGTVAAPTSFRACHRSIPLSIRWTARSARTKARGERFSPPDGTLGPVESLSAAMPVRPSPRACRCSSGGP